MKLSAMRSKAESMLARSATAPISAVEMAPRLLPVELARREAGRKRAAEARLLEGELGHRLEEQVGPGLGDEADGDVERGLVADILGIVHQAARDVDAVAGAQRELLLHLPGFVLVELKRSPR
jgi:hypothetical protein